MIEHTIEDSVKKLLKGFTTSVFLNDVYPSLFELVCNINNWEFNIDEDYNGWEVDWSADIITDSGTIVINGSMYYGSAFLELRN